jgi:Fe-S-cluster containining protein
MIPEIYAIFAEESASIDFVCQAGCATCCTRSVSLTTVEGQLIIEFLRETGKNLPNLPEDQVILRPALTTNGWASLCLAGREVEPEAETSWLFEPCFFLLNGLCTIYPVRPFACRSLGSTVICGYSEVAEAPEWFVTLAIVTNQILEDLDRGGWWGNMADILSYLNSKNGEVDSRVFRDRLLQTQPIPGLLVLAEERPRINRFLAKVRGRIGYNSILMSDP